MVADLRLHRRRRRRRRWMLNNSDSLFLPKSGEEREETEGGTWVARNARAKAHRRWSHTFGRQRIAAAAAYPGFSIWWTSCSHVRTRVRRLAFTHHTTTARTLSACFANFMRDELSLSWINPLSLCIVCRQRLFINYPGYFWDSSFPFYLAHYASPSFTYESVGSISILILWIAFLLLL